ncbi:MAG: hypothetical protein WCV50_00785 [Patescibacteria group bacterium]|jgi:hypothetical protein
MPVPIFDQPVVTEVKHTKEAEIKEKISPWVIFISILLISVMITFGEYAFRDMNRVFNPNYSNCFVQSGFKLAYPYVRQQNNSPKSTCELEKYERVKLILHADIAVPIILVSLVAYLFIRKRTLASAGKAIFFSISVWVGWLSIRIVGEGEYFFVKHYPLFGKYIVFFTLATLLTVLIIYIQNKVKKATQKPLNTNND